MRKIQGSEKAKEWVTKNYRGSDGYLMQYCYYAFIAGYRAAKREAKQLKN